MKKRKRLRKFILKKCRIDLAKQIFVSYLLLAFSLQSFAQEKLPVINLEVKNISVKEVFRKIEKKSGLTVFYKSDQIKDIKKQTFKYENESLSLILNKILDKHNLSFKVVDKVIVIIPKPKKREKSHKVKGKVVSQDDGESFPGVNVFEKGTTNGVSTGVDGKYELTLSSPDAVIVFSYIGYQNQEVEVNDRAVIDAALTSSQQKLDEVVVTALGVSREKKSLGYSVSEIKADELNQAQETDVVTSLSGKVSGVEISRNASGVGGSSRIIIRGISSLGGSNKPLFVIDGIPMQSGSYGQAGEWGGYDMGDGTADINPDDIESLSVLKGPNAAALYGSRAANGVILITTKKGSKRKGVGITLNSSYTYDTPLVIPDFQNKYGQGAYGVYTPNADGTPSREYPWVWSYGPEMKGQEHITWYGEKKPYKSYADSYKDFYKNGFSLSNSISLEAGNDKATTRFSFTDLSSEGLLPGNELRQQTVNLRGTAKLGKSINMDAKITYIHQKVEGRPSLSDSQGNPAFLLAIMPRNISLEDLENNYIGSNGNEFNWLSDVFSGNPYWTLNKLNNEDEKDRMMGLVSFDIKLAKWLKLKLRSGIDYYNRKAMSYMAKGTKVSIPGNFSNSNSYFREINSDFLFTANKNFSKVFDVNLNFGGNLRNTTTRGISQYGSSFIIPDFYTLSNTEVKNSGHGFSEKEVHSLYGMGQFSYSNMLFFDFTLRNDWSSTLPIDNFSYFYHSETLSFVFTELLSIDKRILSFGKLRASYAKVGNDTGPYQTQSYYSISKNNYPYPLASFSSSLPFFDLKPEETYSWEIGADLSFLNNRLKLDFTYYNGYTENQIISAPLSITTAFNSKMINAGRIDNKGIEIQLSATPVEKKDFVWNVNFTYSRNKSEVVELYSNVPKVVLAQNIGVTVEARPGMEIGGIYTRDFKRDEYGNKLIDKNGFAQPGEIKLMGNINPDWIGGIRNSFRYKNISLSSLIDIKMGGEFYAWGNSLKALYGTTAETLEGREEWYATHDPKELYQVPLQGVEEKGYVESGISEVNGAENTKPIDPMMRWYNLYDKNIGAEWIEDASFVKLKELAISYELPKSILSKTALTKASISAIGRNLFFLYKPARHVDPESGYNSGSAGGGIEHNAMPTTRSFGVNLKLVF